MINSSALMMGDEGYTISRSVRLRSSASAYFNRTFGTPTDGKIWTWSGWVKRGSLGSAQTLFSASSDVNNWGYFGFLSGDTLTFSQADAGSVTSTVTTTQVFRDPSSWYHIIVVFDSTQATAANRLKMYVNGSQITAFGTATYLSQNTASRINQATAHQLGRYFSAANYLDGYLTEINFIDGQALTPSSFGETNAVTGVWQPKKYSGTYGTNGFYLNFSDNTSTTTIGYDYSGNGNNWTANNISVTSGVTYDSMIDSPTVSAASSNYCVLNTLEKNGGSVVDGNLNFTNGAATNYMAGSTIVPAGKMYAEFQPTAWGNGNMAVGMRTNLGASNTLISASGGVSYNLRDGTVIYNGTTQGTYTAATGTSDKVMMAYDPATGKLWFGLNGTWFNSGAPASGTGQVYTITTPTDLWRIFIQAWDTTNAICANFGQRPFAYTPPTGFKALNTQNLSAGTITTSGSFTGNASADGPFVYLNGVPTAMTINGNAVTFGTHADKTANGFKVRSSSSSYNASGSNTYSISTTGAKFKYANAQGNP